MQLELTDITKEIYDATKRLEKGSKELFNLAKEMAQTEMVYRKALATQILMLKDVGMSVTLIPDIARGKTADLKFERDLAEAKYTAGRNSLEAIKCQMSGLQSILKNQTEI